jgi:hypothetical protein
MPGGPVVESFDDRPSLRLRSCRGARRVVPRERVNGHREADGSARGRGVSSRPRGQLEADGWAGGRRVGSRPTGQLEAGDRVGSTAAAP